MTRGAQVDQVDYAKVHPDFEAQPSARRWQGALKELVSVLEMQADQLAREEELRPRSGEPRWAWRVLPRGAFVAVQRQAKERIYALRLSRSEPATTPSQQKKWNQELDTFLKYWGIEWFSKAPEHGKEDGVATVFRYSR